MSRAAQAQQAIAEGERDGDPLTVGWALHALVMREMNGTDGPEIVDRGLAAVVGDDPDSMDLRLLLLNDRLVLLGNLDRIAELEAALPPTIALAESLGSARLETIQRLAVNLYLERGDWDQRTGASRPDAHALSPYVSLDMNGAAALIAIRRGDRDNAERHITVVADIPYLSTLYLLLNAQRLTVAKALLAEAEGNVTTAVGILAAWLDPRIEGNAYAHAARAEVLPELIRLALAADDRATADAVVAAVEADAKANDDTKVTMRARMCRAMVDDDPAPLTTAADHFDHLGLRPEAAFALQEAAVRLAMRGDILAARAAFGCALTIYDDLSAVLDLRQIQARLRPYGIRSGSRAAHRRATTGWEALTATEREVAALVAQGGSNPEIATGLFLSPRTIEKHVAHILTKLQVHSRREIAREVTRHNLPIETRARITHPDHP